VSVAEGHGVVVATEDGVVGDRGAVHVPAEVVEDILEALGAGLRDVHLELGGAQRLVAENALDGAQRDAGFEQVRGAAVAQRVNRRILCGGGRARR
jgi:hypothetical protein